MYLLLIHGKPRLRPAEIECMTDVEIALCLPHDLEKPAPPSYADAVGRQAVEAHFRRRAKMTPWELLQEAMKKRQ